MPQTSALRSFRYIGSTVTIHANSRDTHGGFALVEVNGFPGSEPPLHVHTREDEYFHVLEGELLVQRGPDSLVLADGQGAFLPRNVPHTFKITSDHARVLVYVTPGAFEEYFRTFAAPLADGAPSEALPTFERLATVAARHGISFLV